MIDKEWSSLLFSVAKGDITQYDSLKFMDEIEFYHVIQNHEKRMEFEAKHPRIPFF